MNNKPFVLSTKLTRIKYEKPSYYRQTAQFLITKMLLSDHIMTTNDSIGDC